MKILVLGNGGREHALCWKIAQSPETSALYCAPGNAGTSEVATNVHLQTPETVLAFCQEKSIDLVVVGPEAPLVEGIADTLRSAGIDVFGPSAAAAQLEASKTYTRSLCSEFGIPGARWQACTELAEAQEIIRAWGAPIVIKADGLAAGKGVIVAQSEIEAMTALEDMMLHASMGDAAQRVVIEECLIGKEASLFVLCDGVNALPMGLARDHKRIGERDTGPNTGGMGCFTPIGDDTEIIASVMKTIIQPTLSGMQARGAPFQGVLFAGLMLCNDGAKLIEYNVRFGDPECQALMLKMRSDLLPYLLASARGTLGDMPLPEWHDNSIVNVVLAAPGYPTQAEKGLLLPEIPSPSEDCVIFHAGTKRDENAALLSAGGRVLNVCARGQDRESARARAYQAISALGWDAGYYRRDIAQS